MSNFIKKKSYFSNFDQEKSILEERHHSLFCEEKNNEFYDFFLFLPEMDILACADNFRFFSKYDLNLKIKSAVHVSSINHILKLYINNHQKDKQFPS